MKVLEEINEKLDLLIESMKSRPSQKEIGEYIEEKEAQKLLGRGTTWFWQMRKSGRLSFSRINRKVYYSKRDIVALLNENKQEAYRKD